MATRPPVGLPRLSRRSRILLIVGAVVLVGLITGSRLLGTYVNWLWFGEVGFRSVYATVLGTRFGLFFAVGLLVGGLLAINLIIAYRTRPVFVPVSGPDDPVARYRAVVSKRMKLFAIGLPVLVGLIAGTSAQADWQVLQLFLNATPFGVNDPEFGHDIGFYAFQLPFYTWVMSWLFIATAVAFVGAVVSHYLFGGIRLAGRGGQLSGPSRTHLAIVAGTFILLKAVAYFLDRYTLLFSERNDKFDGASYTDLNAVLPAKLILLFIAVFCAIAFFAGAVLRNLQLPAIATVLLVLSSILVGAAWPAVLEQFSVKPNAIEKEAEPINRNIAATRQAFGLTEDKVESKPYAGKQNVSLDELKSDQATLGNVRLLDPAVISKTFTQFQQLRPFYAFPEKLDVDRYKVDQQLQDYIVAVRELHTAGIPAGQRDWINQHLIYTHGNGMVFAEASKVNSPADEGGNGGYPVFEVAEVGQNGEVKPGPFGVQQPRTYYGEMGGPGDYAIVGGRGEGAPGEYDTDGSSYTYDGKGGVRIGGLFNKLVFAAAYGERNILFNSAIGDDSRIIFNRNPRDRVEAVAPWLTVDGDPYPAVVDGRITWIVDGYTTLDNYPYARRTALGEATNDSLPGVAQQPDREISYIRNSVKATVDAYDGSVTLYEMDKQDPVLKAWMGVFPGTVKANSEMSQSLKEHLRYPEDLFKVQREMLSEYHVDNPRDFYSGVSFWDVPSDPTIDNATTIEAQQQGVQQQRDRQPPFYVLAGDPADADKVSFQLTSALVRLNREFMASYVTVGSDPDNYGKISVLTLNNEAKGPQQIQTTFLTNGEVSGELNLLTQRQTKVVYGNLLTLPVGGGLLYVEPIYIERASQNTQFPQLFKVLVSFGDKVGYAPTLSQALEEVLTGAAAQVPGEDNTGQPPTSTPSTTPSTPPADGQQGTELQQAVKDIQTALSRVKAAQASGDFAELGNAYKALDEATKRFDTASAASTQSPSSVQPSPTPTG